MNGEGEKENRRNHRISYRVYTTDKHYTTVVVVVHYTVQRGINKIYIFFVREETDIE